MLIPDHLTCLVMMAPLSLIVSLGSGGHTLRPCCWNAAGLNVNAGQDVTANTQEQLTNWELGVSPRHTQSPRKKKSLNEQLDDTLK